MIALLKDKEAAEAVIEDREHMYPLYHVFYFEEFVKRPPRDIRCIVVVDRVARSIDTQETMNGRLTWLLEEKQSLQSNKRNGRSLFKSSKDDEGGDFRSGFNGK